MAAPVKPNQGAFSFPAQARCAAHNQILPVAGTLRAYVLSEIASAPKGRTCDEIEVSQVQ